MNINVFSYDLAYAMAWTLAHSVWQIGILSLFLFFLLRLFKDLSSNYRYALALGTLGLTLLMTMVTFSVYYIQHPETASVLTPDSDNFSSQVTTAILNIPALAEQHLHYIVNIWLVGVLFLSGRFIIGYGYVTHLAHTATPETASVIKRLSKLKKKFNINRTVLLKQSEKITTPLVIGFLRPVILFPVGFINKLTVQEVSAILAHELAHIKRHDFILNLLQSLAEALFYYHPGIWYITKMINKERENCCDDMAIIHTQSRLSYAKTLIKLQELQHTSYAPALAMAGQNGHFSQRIMRLLKVPVEVSRMRVKILGFVLLAFTMVGFASQALESSPLEPSELDVYIIDDCPKKIEDIKFYLDTIPERNNFHIKKRTNSQDLELEMVDGNIKELKIDGRLIPSNEYDQVYTLIESLTPDNTREVITVFPDCGKDFGNIYYLDKNRQVYRLDNVLKTFDTKLKTFENFDQDKFDFHIDKFDKTAIDALLEELYAQDLSVLRTARVKVDSVFDLLPTKISDFNIALTNGGFSLALPSAQLDEFNTEE